MVGRLLFLVLLLGVPTIASTATTIDSLREKITTAYQDGKHDGRSWNALIRQCAGAPACFEDQLTWAKTVGDSLKYPMFESIGMYHIQHQQPRKAITWLRRGLRLATAEGLPYPEGTYHGLIGYAYTNLTTQTDSAAYYLYRSIEAFGEEHRNKAWNAYYSLGYLNDQLGLPDRSVTAMETSYKLARASGSRMNYGFALYHLLALASKYDSTEVFEHYLPDYAELRATSKSQDPRHDALISFLEDNDKGMQQLQAFIDRPDFEAVAGADNKGHLVSNLAAAYVARGRYIEAEHYVLKAIDYDQSTGRVGNLQRSYRQLADLGRLADRSDLVAEGLTGYQAIQDSMNRADYQASISRMEVEYETQKTRTELAESELSLSESRRQRNQLLLGGFALLSLLVGGFIYYQSRLKLQRLRAEVARENQERELAEVRRQSELSNLRALIEGQEVERSRVAKDLHDGLGGLLTTVKAHVARIPDTKEAEDLIDRACTSVRRIAHNMVPQTLAQSGLTVSLGDLADQLKVQGFDVDLEVVGKPEDHLDLTRQSIILRIAQELTHNVVKHAGAKSILLQLLAREEKVLLTVEDDGKGFNLDYARRAGGGLGLASIEQRVDYLEGTIMFDSRVGVGTTVSVEV